MPLSCSPTPPILTARDSKQAGTSAPMFRAILYIALLVIFGFGATIFSNFNTAAAFADPPPSPAAMGIFLKILILIGCNQPVSFRKYSNVLITMLGPSSSDAKGPVISKSFEELFTMTSTWSPKLQNEEILSIK